MADHNNVTNPKTEFYFNKSAWHDEVRELRRIVLDCGLTEELKWGVPCYMYGKGNVVLIHVFKEYCALLFFKGALLQDTENIFVQQTENVQAGRQLRFTNVKQILEREATIKAYLYEAIEVEKAGLKVPMKKTEDYDIPDEFREKLDGSHALKTAFESLTPGRQRAYIFYFSLAKQSKTRMARVEKYIPKILEGKGLED